MNKSIENTILNRIHGNGMGWVFSPRDLANIGSRSAIGLALYRLEQKKKIHRVIRGIFYYPKIGKLLDHELPPEIDRIARALARKFGWRTQPGSAMALNLLGLSTQVPARAVYLSTGPHRTYELSTTTLIFEHSALKETNFKRPESGLIVQALKTLGPKRITPEVIAKIRAWLDPSLRKRVLDDSRSATGWVYAAIQKIARTDSHG
jgi:hypothetical protein